MKIELNKKYSLDLGSSSPVEVEPIEFLSYGVKCKYLSSWSGRIEIIGYDFFEMNGYSNSQVKSTSNEVFIEPTIIGNPINLEIYKCLDRLSHSVGETINEYHWRELCGLMLAMEENGMIEVKWK